MKYMLKSGPKFLCTCLLTMILAVLLFGCGEADNPSATTSDATTQSGATQEEPSSDEVTFDTPFEFDNLTITFGSGCTTSILENEYSEYNGATVVAIPITITNNSEETHGLNMFYYTMYSPDGTQLDDISSYYMEDDVAWAGDMRSGATMESFMHILYTGPGDYYVEFSGVVSIDDKIEVRLPIEF